VRDFARELADEHFGLDSKIARTVRDLVTHPGALTLEYLAGHRARFVRPLRLYFSASVLFFLLLALRGPQAGVVKVSVNGTTAAQPGATVPARGTDEMARAFAEKFTHWLGDAMFLLLPAFAGIVALLVRGHRTYGEHFVFALHVHAFAFLALIPPLLVPASWRSVSDVSGLVVMVYTILALRRVYALTPWRTALVTAALGVLYGIVLASVMAGLAWLTILTIK
jgi:hypothetical protein